MEAAVAHAHDPTASLAWLEPIYREHSRMILHTAYRLTGSAEDAEDVLQTLFIRLARREVLPDLSRGAGPYLRRAATNASLDLLRSRRSRGTATLEEMPPARSDSPDADPQRVLASRDLRARLREALAELNERGAEMFVLRYLDGMSNHEIAELFDTSPGTVAVTLHRVRARLMTALSPHMGGLQ